MARAAPDGDAVLGVLGAPEARALEQGAARRQEPLPQQRDQPPASCQNAHMVSTPGQPRQQFSPQLSDQE